MISRQLKDTFIDRVKKQALYYGELKDIMNQEERSLLGKDINALDRVVKKEEEIIGKISAIEEEKKALYKEMAEATGFKDAADVTLKEVLVAAGQEDAAEIEVAVVQLVEAVKAIDTANAKNLHVIKNYIQYVDFARTMKEKLEKPSGTTYDAKGYKKKEATPNKLNIDKKI